MNSLLQARPAVRGSALVATFWLIAVMGLLVFGSLQFVAIDTRCVTAQRGLAQARRLAERGLALGAHPEVKKGDPLLANEDGNEAYFTIITSEEARLNPNALITAKAQIVLNRLFLVWGMESDQAAALTGAFVDWVDPDDSISLNGSESAVYTASGRPGLPLNRPFASFDEMRMVEGMDALEVVHPSWRDAFTLWTFGQVDLNEASPDVIVAATGVRLTNATRIWDTLAGRDGVRFTSDDLRFATVEEALKKLGVGGKPSPLFGVDSQTRHVESIGKAGDFQCRLVIVLSGSVPLHREEMPMPLAPIRFAQ